MEAHSNDLSLNPLLCTSHYVLSHRSYIFIVPCIKGRMLLCIHATC